jgi:hypothetical protein
MVVEVVFFLILVLILKCLILECYHVEFWMLVLNQHRSLADNVEGPLIEESILKFKKISSLSSIYELRQFL